MRLSLCILYEVPPIFASPPTLCIYVLTPGLQLCFSFRSPPHQKDGWSSPPILGPFPFTLPQLLKHTSSRCGSTGFSHNAIPFAPLCRLSFYRAPLSRCSPLAYTPFCDNQSPEPRGTRAAALVAEASNLHSQPVTCYLILQLTYFFSNSPNHGPHLTYLNVFPCLSQNDSLFTFPTNLWPTPLFLVSRLFDLTEEKFFGIAPHFRALLALYPLTVGGSAASVPMHDRLTVLPCLSGKQFIPLSFSVPEARSTLASR